ncbi:hypothetical protein ACLOJK_019076 [Asimina triloba]
MTTRPSQLAQREVLPVRHNLLGAGLLFSCGDTAMQFRNRVIQVLKSNPGGFPLMMRACNVGCISVPFEPGFLGSALVSALSLPPSPLAGADLPFPSPSRCRPLVPLYLSLPLSPLAGADSPFSSPSRCAPVSFPSSSMPSLAPCNIHCRRTPTHPPTLAPLLFPTHFFSQGSGYPPAHFGTPRSHLLSSPPPSHDLLLLQPRSTAPSHHLVATIAHLLSSPPFLSSGRLQGSQPLSIGRHRPSPFFPANSLLHFPPPFVASSFAVSATTCSDFFPNPKPISSQIDFPVSATVSNPNPPSSAGAGRPNRLGRELQSW